MMKKDMRNKSFNDMVKSQRMIEKGVTQYAEDMTWQFLNDDFASTFPLSYHDESSIRTREMAKDLAETLKMRYQGANVQYTEHGIDEITVLFVAYPDQSFSKTMEVEFTIDTDYRIIADNRNVGTETELNSVDEAVQYIDALMRYLIKMAKMLKSINKSKRR